MHVNVYATLRPIVGDRFVDLPIEEGATVHDLIACMVDRWPELAEMMLENGEVSRRVHVFIDGRSSRHLPAGSETPLHGGQRIDVSPAVAGG